MAPPTLTKKQTRRLPQPVQRCLGVLWDLRLRVMTIGLKDVSMGPGKASPWPSW